MRVHCRPDGSVAVAEVLVPQAAEPPRAGDESSTQPVTRVPLQRKPPDARLA